METLTGPETAGKMALSRALLNEKLLIAHTEIMRIGQRVINLTGILEGIYQPKMSIESGELELNV